MSTPATTTAPETTSTTTAPAPSATTSATPPATSSASPSASSTAPAASASDWRSGLSDDHKALVELKQFKDPSAVLESYKNLESLTGLPPDRILKLPESVHDLKNLLPIMDRLGRPKDAAGYEFKPATPEQKMDPQLEAFARPLFHELGLTKAQGETLVSKWNAVQAQAAADMAKAAQVEFANQEAALKKEWGSAFDQNVKIAKQGAAALGLDSATVDKLQATMGFDGVMKFIHNLGVKVGEDTFVGSEGPAGDGFAPLTPAAAKAKIEELIMTASFQERLRSGDPLARKEWDHVHKMAYSGA